MHGLTEMSITEKVSYLKGLLEGFKIDTTTSEGKVLTVMADILDELAVAVSELKQDTEYLNDYVEELDDDLADVEDDLDDLFDDEDEEDDDEDEDEDDEDDEYGDLFEVTCPSCGEKVFLDDSIDPSRIICPACNAEFSDIIEK